MADGFIFAYRHPSKKKQTHTMTLKFIFSLFMAIYGASVYGQLPGSIWPKGEAGIDFNVKNAKGQKDGLWIRTYEGSTNLFSKGTFKKDVPIGVWEKYYLSGELQSIQTHLGKDSVQAQIFHTDGKTLMAKGLFVKKKKEGNWKMYEPNGILKNDENYTDSILNGACKYFFASGNLWKTLIYKQGIPNGPFTEYFENGKKRSEGTYLLDEKDGEYKAWFENGNPESSGKFVKGQMEGNWYYYNKDGSVQVAILYKLGKETKRKYQNGTIKENYDSGIPKSEYTYEDAKKDGPFTEWYDKGEYVLVEPEDPELKNKGYQKLELQGIQMKVQGDYVNDKYEGDVIYYFEDGRIEKIEEWLNGELVKTKQAGK